MKRPGRDDGHAEGVQHPSLSDNHGLFVFAIDPAHGVGDFAHRRASLDRFDDRWHQVRATARAVFHLLDRGLPLRLVAFCTQSFQPLDLFALQ